MRRPSFRLSLLALLVTASWAHAQSSSGYEFRTLRKGLAVTEQTYLLQLSSASLSFSGVPLGDSTLLTSQVMNIGNSAISLQEPLVAGAGFTLTTSCGATLQPQASCLLSVTFAPGSAGAASGSVSMASSASNSPLLLALSGTGLQALAALSADTSSSFGNVAVSTTATRLFTFTNTGNTTATNVSASLMNAPASLSVLASQTTCGTVGSPSSVPAGSSCKVAVQYSPTATESLSNVSLSVTSGATPSAVSLPLTGSASGIDVSFEYTGTIQTFTVPVTGTYVITTRGAAGGDSTNTNSTGGYGAQQTCGVTLTAGTVLKVLVGQMGASTRWGGNGGGGSFVATDANVAVAVAGGGGGASPNMSGNWGVPFNSGTDGGGASGYGAGGGGFVGNGANSLFGTGGGKSFVNGGAGGVGKSTGGFGGGGSSSAGNAPGGYDSGGGGGGYTGGHGGGSPMSVGPGGGGGSYCAGTVSNAQPAATLSNGFVRIAKPN